MDLVKCVVKHRDVFRTGNMDEQSNHDSGETKISPQERSFLEIYGGGEAT